MASPITKGLVLLFLAPHSSIAFCTLSRTSSIHIPATGKNNKRCPQLHALFTTEQTDLSSTPSIIPVAKICHEDHSHASQLESLRTCLADLTSIRPPLPQSDSSAPIALISAGSSYTRLWTEQTWSGHSEPPHHRYWKHIMRWPFSSTSRKIFPALCYSMLWAGFSGLVCNGIWGASGPYPKMLAGVGSVLGTFASPLALLLTLRTNQSLSRLLEARLAWGRLILYTRSMAGMLKVYILPKYPEAAVSAAKHLAIMGWLLKGSVRFEPAKEMDDVMACVFTGDDLIWLKAQTKSYVGVALRLRQIVNAVLEKEGGAAFASQHLILEEQIMEIERVSGICERLLSSPIPPTYSRHLSRILGMWLFLLPFGLIGNGFPLWGVVSCTAFTSYVFMGIDEIGMEIENPFPLLPLQQLAGAVQKMVEGQMITNGGDLPAVTL